MNRLLFYGVIDAKFESKKRLRTELTAARRAFAATPSFAAANDAIAAEAARRAAGLRVAAYAPLGSEPGGAAFAETLYASAAEVWLPISGDDGQLLWARYEGAESLAPGALGIGEPTGPRRDSSLLAELDLIFVPALAVSPAGVRMGKGAGYYDRALGGVDTDTLVLVFDDEVREDVPAEPHDAVMNAVLTQSGVRALPLS